MSAEGARTRIADAISSTVELTKHLDAATRGPLLPSVFNAVLTEMASPPVITPAGATSPLTEKLDRLNQLEQVIAIAAERLEQTGSDAVTTEDIRTAYDVRRLPVPGNLAEVLARCARRRWLTPMTSRDGHRVWRLTQLGRTRLRRQVTSE